jgi:capsular exopolysaccharide synthesis family protein
MESKFTFIENPTEQISNIKDYIFRVISNWKWFVAAISVAMAIAFYMNLSTEKLYGLKTTILVQEKQNPLFSSGTNIAFNWGGVSDKVESIRKALITRSHNEKVVKELQFYIEYLKEGKFRFEDVYGNTPFTLVLQPNQYQLLNTQIKVEIIDNESFRLTIDFVSGTDYNLINYKDEKIQSLNNFNTNEIFSKVFLFDEYINLPFLKGQLARTENAVLTENDTYYIILRTINQVTGSYQNARATGLAGTSLVEISLTGANKNRIVDYLNKTVEVLAKDQLEAKTNYARSTKQFIDAQFKNTSDSLKLIEDNIGKFKKENLIYQLSAEGNEIFSQTIGLDKLQIELMEKIAYLHNLEDYIKTHTNYTNIPAPAIINIEDASIPGMMSQLTELSIQKEKLSEEVTANHPALIEIEDEVETTRNVLLENLASLVKATEVVLENSRRKLNSYNYELNKLPNKEQQLLNFQRRFSLTESNYIFLMQKRYEAEIAIAATVSDISVLDSAKDTGQGSIYPRVSFNYMVALLLGTIIPLFFIIAKEILDTHIHNADEIERTSPMPILGIVGKKTTKSDLTVFLKTKSAVSESFRALRSNLQFIFMGNKKLESKTILVTSSVSGEGKTFVSINLATVFALGNKKTILVGLDLRKPRIYDDFGMTNEIGVVNFLIGEESKESIIQKTEVPNLDLILAGPIPPNPSELLISVEIEELMKHLKETYEYIIIDTPPVGIVSDAIELLKYADASIYVVRQNYTQKGMLKMINEKYEKKEVKNMTIVLNDFNVKSKYGYEYGYGYGHEKYGKYYKGYYDGYKRRSFLSKLFKKKRF